jgi:hypothetical protein
VTSQKADSSMTAAKTATVMNFVAWLFTPRHLGNWIQTNQSGADTNSGLRLVQEYIDGSLSYSAFASQWQSLLTSSAQQWATANHVDLSEY